MAGHKSRTSTTSRARLSLASSQPAPMEKKVGEGDDHHVGRTARAPAEQHAGDHETQVIDGLADHPLVRSGVQPGAHDPVTVTALTTPNLYHGTPVVLPPWDSSGCR